MAVTIRDDYPAHAARGGACYLCGCGRRDTHDADGNPTRERVVDFGVMIDMEGFLIICETCGREIAEALGMITAADRDAAVDASVAMADELQALTEELAGTKLLVALLRRYDEVNGPPPMLIQASADVAAQAADDAAVTAADGAAVREQLAEHLAEESAPARKTKPRASRAKATA